MAAPLPLATLFEEYDLAITDVMNALRVSRETVRLMRRGKRQISTDSALILHRKFRIPRYRLRPDVWEAPKRRVSTQ